MRIFFLVLILLSSLNSYSSTAVFQEKKKHTNSSTNSTRVYSDSVSRQVLPPSQPGQKIYTNSGTEVVPQGKKSVVNTTQASVSSKDVTSQVVVQKSKTLEEQRNVVDQSNFLSIHQIPLRVTTKATWHGDSINEHQEFKGFKNQFSPKGHAGCQLGNSVYRSECVFFNNSTLYGLGFSAIVPEVLHTSSNSSTMENSKYFISKEFKFFIPKGVVHASAIAYLPQGTKVAVAVRFGQAPNRTSILDSDYTQASQVNHDTGVTFEKLKSGQEIVIAHTGGGSMQILPTFRTSKNPQPSDALTQGYWAYVRVIKNENKGLYLPAFTYEAIPEIYTSWYDNASFDSNGDPN